MAEEKRDPTELVRFKRDDGSGDFAVAPRSTFESLYDGNGYVEVDDSGDAVKTRRSTKSVTGGDV